MMWTKRLQMSYDRVLVDGLPATQSVSEFYTVFQQASPRDSLVIVANATFEAG